MAPPVVKIHPVALLTIVDYYERRNEGAERVIGTLLGIVEKGAVEITNCFCVPHNECGDEVAVNMEFAKDVYDLHRKVNSQEVIVGWFATGLEVTSHSLLIHEYYCRETSNAIHLLVDTKMHGDRMEVKGYIGTHFGVPRKNIGTMFTPCKVDVIGYAPELVGLSAIKKTRLNKQRTVEIPSDLDHIDNSVRSIEEMMDLVIAYLDEVLAGRVVPDNTVGRTLMDMVQSIPQMDPQEFNEMLCSNMKDLLMVLYLTQLSKTQLGLHEKMSLI